MSFDAETEALVEKLISRKLGEQLETFEKRLVTIEVLFDIDTHGSGGLNSELLKQFSKKVQKPISEKISSLELRLKTIEMTIKNFQKRKPVKKLT